MATLEEHAKSLDFRGLMITSIITALSFTVGLFWRDAITATIDEIIPDQNSIFFKFVVAVLITIFVGVIAYFLMKSQEIRIEQLIEIAKKGGKVKTRKKNKAQKEKKGVFNIFDSE
jgi:short subunit fatty acids transporter